MAPTGALAAWPAPRAAREAAERDLAPLWTAAGTSKVERAAQLRKFLGARSNMEHSGPTKNGPTLFDFEAAGQVGSDLTNAMGAGAQAAAPAVGNAAQAGAEAAMSGAQAAAPMVQDAASSAAGAVMSGAQVAAPMVGDAASSLAGSLGDAANSLGDSASDGNCFPATATVFERHRGIIHMASVRIGDRLASGAGDFSEVIAFLHFDPGATMNCISVVHETGALVLSSDHLISMRRGLRDGETGQRFVRAQTVRRGDLLQDAGGHPSAVLRVRKCCAKGRFAPLTDRGTLVVGGAHCSCFAPPQAFHFGHSLCHAAVAPLRAVAVLRRSGFCVEEVFAAAALLFSENCDRTLHPFCAALLRAARWYDGSVRKVRDSEASANEHFLWEPFPPGDRKSVV